MSHPDIMCEVEVDSNIVEVVDSENFNDIGGVTYGHYDVGVGDDQYEEVTCETEDSQGMMMQTIEDGKRARPRQHESCTNLYFPNCVLTANNQNRQNLFRSVRRRCNITV